MAVDIALVKRLNDLTGVGLTDAKAALEEAKGDFDKALEAMRKKGLTKAEKRAERETRAGVVTTYNHDDRIGVVVEVNCETDFVARNELFLTLVKDVAMQIAATNPEYVTSADIPESVREKVASEFADKVRAEGKPANMVNTIVDAQVKKYFAEKSLLEQPFIKNPDQTVSQYVAGYNARLGENIIIRRFARFALGEVS